MHTKFAVCEANGAERVADFYFYIHLVLRFQIKSEMWYVTFYCISGQRLEAQHLSQELNALNDQLRSKKSYRFLPILPYSPFLHLLPVIVEILLNQILRSPCEITYSILEENCLMNASTYNKTHLQQYFFCELSMETFICCPREQHLHHLLISVTRR